MVGTTIGSNRVLREIGRGGMGIVYLAEDPRLGRKVAIKALPPETARDPVRRKRFEQEARAAAALSHAGIAQVHQLEEQGEDLFIVFEYVEGSDLRGLARSGTAPSELLKIAICICRALAFAHSQGIVHRDLKPENVLLTSTGETKILDFGLARFQPGALENATVSAALTSAGSIVGTVGYMSPEQLECKEVDFRSDIFSFGVMLYELASGTHPFQGGSAASTIASILHQEPPPLTAANPVSPPELARIVNKCLRKRREERYQSTQDLLVDLENLQRGGDSKPLITSNKVSRRWWWTHHVGTMFVTTPLLVYLLVHAGPAIADPLRMPLLFLEAFAVALNWSLRFALVTTAIGDPPGLVSLAKRLRPWITWTGWTLIAGLIAIAFSIADKNVGLAIVIASLAMGGVVSVLFLEPLTEKAALGG